MIVGEVTKDFRISKPTRKGTSPTESLCHLSPEQLKEENPGDPGLAQVNVENSRLKLKWCTVKSNAGSKAES